MNLKPGDLCVTHSMDPPHQRFNGYLVKLVETLGTAQGWCLNWLPFGAPTEWWVIDNRDIERRMGPCAVHQKNLRRIDGFPDWKALSNPREIFEPA